MKLGWYRISLLVCCLLSLIAKANAQTEWFEVKWRNEVGIENELFFIDQVSENRANLTRVNSEFAFRFKYGISINKVLNFAGYKAYIGFKPEFGSEVGISFKSGFLRDTIIYNRDYREVDKIPIAIGDSVALYLKEGITELKVNDEVFAYSSFGGTYADKVNRVWLESSSVLQGFSAQATKPYCMEKSPILLLNGDISENGEESVCPEESVNLGVANFDIVKWSGVSTSCINCQNTRVLSLKEGQNIVNFQAADIGCPLVGVEGVFQINLTSDSVEIPEQIVVCSGTQTNLIVDWSTVFWKPSFGVMVNCDTCLNVNITANRSGVLQGHSILPNGCSKFFDIPVYFDEFPDVEYQMMEEVNEKGKVEMFFRADNKFLDSVFWEIDNEIIEQNESFVLKRPIEDDLELVVKSKFCGFDSVLITPNYPAITPLKYSVFYTEGYSMAYDVVPYSCSGCEVFWSFSDGGTSISRSGLYSFSGPGNYEVKIRVVDRLGREVTRSKSIKIF